MKRFLYGFLAVLFLILNTIPYLHIFADDMPTNSQYEMLGAYALSTLITSGEATELDFSDYTENDTSFLIDLGEAIFTGDWSGLAEDGLTWLGDTADSIYDSYKEYISQWKSDHLGLMYSNWFPDEEIYVGPDDSYSLAKPLRELLTPRSNNEPIPSPDINYQSYLDRLNKREHESRYFWWFDCAETYQRSNYYGLLKYPTTSYSWWYTGNNSNTSGFGSDSGAQHCCDILNLYINSVSDVYSINISVNSYTQVSWVNAYRPEPSTIYNAVNFRVNNGDVWPDGRGDNVLTYTFSQSGTLTQVLEFCCNHFKNVNLYVDNVLWAYVGGGPTYPIVIPGQLTIYNNQPLEYTFPTDTHIDLPDLTSIIRNAINSSGLVMWSDIADVFVDINGQTAVAVTKIVRNDYDNLYMEQYPYPAMLIGMTDQTKFNEHLLDNSHAYLSPMGTVVQETVNILPSELVGVLAIGAILTIFAVIINRLLE